MGRDHPAAGLQQAVPRVKQAWSIGTRELTEKGMRADGIEWLLRCVVKDTGVLRFDLNAQAPGVPAVEVQGGFTCIDQRDVRAWQRG
jgi:hypothetical protein